MMHKIFLSFLLAIVLVIVPLAKSTIYYGEVAMDDSGKTIYAANSLGIHVSMNAGATWSLSSNCAAPSTLRVSSNGQYAMAVFDPSLTCGPVQVTNDYGKTWSKPSFPLKANTMIDGDISGTGQYMVAVNFASGNGNDEIFVSTNYGASFQAIPRTDSINLYSAAITKTADRILVGQSVGILFQSKDFGATFAPMTTTPYTGYYSTLAMNDDGNYLLATTAFGINQSKDGGSTWNETALPRNGQYKTVLSGSGQYQLVGGSLQHLTLSTDYGSTWTTMSKTTPLTNWASLDMNQDGQYVVASSEEKGLYLSSDYGQTWTLSTL